jgi:STE24 endopeptidase
VTTRDHRALAKRYFSAEEIDRSERYHRPARRVGWAAATVSLGWMAALAFGPAGRWVASAALDLPRWAYALSFSALVVATAAVIRLPFSFWCGYVHEHRWGFSTRTVAGWFGDWLKSLALSTALTCVTMLGLIVLAGRLPQTWPAVAGPAAAGLVIVLSFAGPVVFEPIFNRFRPLDDAALAGELRALADRAGVPVRQVLVADASRRTRKENAYVSGLARTRRIVVFDTLLARGSPGEVRLVVAHELGHWRDRHVVRATALGATGAAIGIVILFFLLRLHPLLDVIHAGSPADPRIVPFVLLAGAVGGVLVQPFGVAISRRWERTADSVSLELTGDPEGLAEMQRNLAIANLAELTPSRLAYLFRYTHPAPAERIAAALGLTEQGAAGRGRAPAHHYP